jgi:DNA replication protein DnaC
MTEETKAVCPDCWGLGVVKKDLQPGDPDFGKLFPCPNPFHDADRYQQLAQRSGLKSHELKYTLASFKRMHNVTQPMIDLMRNFLDDPKGWLYMYGGPGNGKTLCLMAAVNHFINQGRSALYITLADLLEVMRETFKHTPFTTAEQIGEDAWSKWGTYQGRFSRVQTVELLAIDEFDANKVNQTQFATEFRARLIDHRYRDAIGLKTVTLFAGNDDPALLPMWVYDRVRDSRFILFHNKAESVRMELEW